MKEMTYLKLSIRYWIISFYDTRLSYYSTVRPKSKLSMRTEKGIVIFKYVASYTDFKLKVIISKPQLQIIRVKASQHKQITS